MKKQTSIKNFFLKRPSLDAAQDDASSKRPKPDSQSPAATEEAPSVVKGKPNLAEEEESLLDELYERLADEQHKEKTLDEAVATKNIFSTAIQPFLPRKTYVCPFKAVGRCSHKTSLFNSYRGLCRHVLNEHPNDGVVVSYAISKLEDGTAKIPCPNGCTHMSVTHQKANHHAKNEDCTATPPASMQCSWHPYTGCTTVGTARKLGMHHRSHEQDLSGPYQCSKDACGKFFASLYLLAHHEERCKKREASLSRTSYRFTLKKAAEASHPPKIIIVNRSSSSPPKEWKAKTQSIYEGLPIIGKSILAHYIAMSSANASGISAVIHSCSNCSTRQLPAPAVNQSIFEENLHQHLSLHRAFKFTAAIVEDIQAANDSGITPILISVGLDGWACDIRMIHPWMQVSNLLFELVIRTAKPVYGMTDRFAVKHGNVYWWTYQSKAIWQALEQGAGAGHDEKADELIAAWKLLQSSKDVAFGMSSGRNAVDTTPQFPQVE